MNWKKEYIAKLGCVNVEELQIEAALAIKLENMPKQLYKYRSTSDNAINNLENDTVWLNSPSEYNDPFEFTEYIDSEKYSIVIENSMKDELISDLVRNNPVPNEILEKAKNSDSALKVIAEYQFIHIDGQDEKYVEIFMKIYDDFFKKFANDRNGEKIKEMQEHMKVCSFCESPEQLLMWSHYSDFHKGFCVEYNIGAWAINDNRRRILYPVIYQDNFYDVTGHLIKQTESGHFNNLYPIISGATKSKEWEYEKEWRFIFNIGPSFEKQNYSMNCQSKVFLGSRMNSSDKERILEICRRKNIEVYQAKTSVSHYKMEFILIT